MTKNKIIQLIWVNANFFCATFSEAECVAIFAKNLNLIIIKRIPEYISSTIN